MKETVLVAILSPILLTIGGIFTWFLKTRKESLQLVEERSREKRMETYKEILDPIITLLTPTASKQEKERATNTIGSTKYKKASFDLVIFGSDNTVECFNEMMQYLYNNEGVENEDNIKLLKLFAGFILNIRKDLFYKRTKLKRSQVLDFTITDIKNYRKVLDD